MVGIHLLWKSVQKRRCQDGNQKDIVTGLRKRVVHSTPNIQDSDWEYEPLPAGLLCEAHELCGFSLQKK